MAWVGGWAWSFNCRVRDVEVNGSGMSPGSAIVFAMGLYAVTAQGGSFFDSGARYVFICCW